MSVSEVKWYCSSELPVVRRAIGRKQPKAVVVRSFHVTFSRECVVQDRTGRAW
jgi:hypothetical protein